MATYEKVNKLEELKGHLKDMTWKERLDYLWEYYKWVAILAGIAVVIVASVISGIVRNSKNLLCGGIAVNVSVTEEGTAYLTDGWFAKLEGTEGKDKIELTPMYINLEAGAYSETATANVTKLISMISVGDVDYLLLDAYALQYCGSSGAFAPLENTLSQEMLAKFEGKIVTIQDEKSEYQAAIDISELPFVKKHITSKDKVYIAFPGNTERSAQNEAFLEYLMNWSE